MTLYLPASGLKSYINTNIKFKILNQNYSFKKFLHFRLANFHDLKLLTIIGNVGRYYPQRGLLFTDKNCSKKGTAEGVAASLFK